MNTEVWSKTSITYQMPSDTFIVYELHEFHLPSAIAQIISKGLPGLVSKQLPDFVSIYE